MIEGLREITKDTLGHAYLIQGDENSARELVDILKTMLPEKTPALSFMRMPTFGVDDSRLIVESGSESAMEDTPVMNVISADAITFEAQNALLKVLEEPAAHTHFFFILPRIDRILPTFRSRCRTIVDKKSALDPSIDARLFASMSLGERMKFVQTFIKEREDQESDTIKKEIDHLAEAIAHVLTEKKKSGELEDNQIIVRAYSSLSLVREYVADRGSSTKMIIEYLALALPQF